MLNKKSFKDAMEYAEVVLRSGLVPYLGGSPGLGKSALIHKIAKKYNLKVIDIRLAQEDPTTINGFPCLDDGRSKYLPPELFPLEGLDEVPEGYDGWIVFIDELPSAPRAVQAAAYKIILDRMIGQLKIHKKCLVAAAGNLSTDNAIVNEMGTALRSRMIHIHMASNSNEFIDHMVRAKFDTRIITYLTYQKNKVNNFDQYNKKSSDETFTCERTWEFTSNLLNQCSPDQSQPIDDYFTDLLCGTIGSNAIEFVQYTHAFKELPALGSILANPHGCSVPEKPSIKYLLMGMLVNSADDKNIDQIMDYILRLSKDFQFIFTKMLWSKSDRFLENAKVEKVFDEVADLLM